MERDEPNSGGHFIRLIVVYLGLGAALFAVVGLWVSTGLKLWGKHVG